MRSRNGNRPFILSGLTLVSTLSFGADYYYIGYRLTIKDIQPVHETLSVGKAMLPCSGLPHSEMTFERFSDEPLEKVLARKKNIFLDYALPDAVRIKSRAEFSPSASGAAYDTLTLPTQCYAVEFNDGFVTITLIK